MLIAKNIVLRPNELAGPQLYRMRIHPFPSLRSFCTFIVASTQLDIQKLSHQPQVLDAKREK